MSNYSASKFDMHPNTPWFKVLELIPQKAKVLDIGCSSGNFGAVLIERKSCVVDGVELDIDDAKKAAKVLSSIKMLNIETDDISEIEDKYYDVVYFGDVIEHLVNPVAALKRVKSKLKPGGSVIFSIPNMAHMSVRLMLMGGKFDYGNTGLLDKTHLHFYDLDEITRVFSSAGYRIENLDWVARDIPKDMLDKQLHELGLESSHKFIKLSKSLDAAAYQFIGKAVPSSKVMPAKSRAKVSPSINDFDNFLSQLRKNYEAEIELLRNRVAELELESAKLQKVHNSLAWKLSKPVRAATRGIRHR
jgi:2-polyprenyl-3-methyl-5-hydroxy-6-metoxy-1,4-benzoquinol methylase